MLLWAFSVESIQHSWLHWSCHSAPVSWCAVAINIAYHVYLICGSVNVLMNMVRFWQEPGVMSLFLFIYSWRHRLWWGATQHWVVAAAVTSGGYYIYNRTTVTSATTFTRANIVIQGTGNLGEAGDDVEEMEDLFAITHCHFCAAHPAAYRVEEVARIISSTTAPGCRRLRKWASEHLLVIDNAVLDEHGTVLGVVDSMPAL